MDLYPVLDKIVTSPCWFWLLLGGLLLTAELLGTAGYLLWLGLSAILIGVIAWWWPIGSAGWPWLGSGFCLLSLVTASLWHRWQQHYGHTATTQLLLNQPQQQLIGYQTILETALVNGIGRLRIGDGSWRIQAAQPMMAGTTIMVVAIEGITLRVVPADQVSTR